MAEAHRILGAVAIIAVVVAVVSTLVTRRREPGVVVWTLFATAVASLGVQVGLGLAMLASGREGAHGLHYLYGASGMLVLGLTVTVARAFIRDRWIVLTWGGSLALLLVARAFVTGSR